MRKELLKYVSLAKFLKDALGERYDIVLRDIEDLEQTYEVNNRVIINSKEEDFSQIDLLNDIIGSVQLQKEDYFCSFSNNQKTNTGVVTSIYYIRNEEDKIVGFLSIQEKKDANVTVKEVIDEMLSPFDDEVCVKTETSRKISDEVNGLMSERIEKVWKPYKEMDKLLKVDKMNFIRELFETGMFRMKGIAPLISEITGLSQASIYRYLGEIIEE